MPATVRKYEKNWKMNKTNSLDQSDDSVLRNFVKLLLQQPIRAQ